MTHIMLTIIIGDIIRLLSTVAVIALIGIPATAIGAYAATRTTSPNGADTGRRLADASLSLLWTFLILAAITLIIKNIALTVGLQV